MCRFLSYMNIYSTNILYVGLSELRYLWMLPSLLFYQSLDGSVHANLQSSCSTINLYTCDFTILLISGCRPKIDIFWNLEISIIHFCTLYHFVFIIIHFKDGTIPNKVGYIILVLSSQIYLFSILKALAPAVGYNPAGIT